MMRAAISRKQLTFSALAMVALAAAFGFWSWGEPAAQRSQAANEQEKTEIWMRA